MNVIKELWHGNIVPQEDSRTNSKEIKELLGYMARHHEDLEKSFTDEQKETFEKFHNCWSEYMSLAEAAIFEYAFKLGLRIAMEIIDEQSNKSTVDCKAYGTFHYLSDRPQSRINGWSPIAFSISSHVAGSAMLKGASCW